MEPFFLHTYNEPVKELIEKYDSGKITCIYGNAASGISASCLLAAISCARENGKVIYVDTDGKFNVDRLSQLYCGDIKSILDNIFLIQPKTFDEQHNTILKLKKLAKKDNVKLVVVDTIGSKYRKVLNEDHSKINEMMTEQMVTLYRIARDLNKIVLITNQASAKLDGSNEIRMVGGKLIEKMCKIIIELQKKDDKRYATLIKHKLTENTSYYKLGKQIMFEIKENGLFLTS